MHGEPYLGVVRDALLEGNYKPNRTGIDTISGFSDHREYDLRDGFPLVTTKRMDSFRWDSIVEELLWFLSGEEHIRNLDTGIWDEWATDNGRLDTAYGRFWRRFPIPENEDQLPGETWPDDQNVWVNEGEGTFDQIRCIIDRLEENPNSRRMVLTAWHPANANTSTLPPCHFTSVFNVQEDRLNLHLTQRSGDIALGVPFNIASYSLLLKIVAQETGFKPGKFSHTIVDSHIYCGSGDRGEWYESNLDDLRGKLYTGSFVAEVDGLDDAYRYIEENAPGENEKNEDHVPNLLKQLNREPFDKPEVRIADKPINELEPDDIELQNYQSHGPLDFEVAE